MLEFIRAYFVKKFFMYFLLSVRKKLYFLGILLLVGVSIWTGVKVFSPRSLFPVILVLQTNPVSAEELDFLKKANPYGILLLKNTLDHGLFPDELKRQLQHALKRKNIYFFIDQEGGTVNRLAHIFPHKKYPPLKTLGELARKDENKARQNAYEYGFSVGQDLAKFGLDVNFAPTAEICLKNNFLGDRCIDEDPAIVSVLADAFARGLAKAHVIPVYKHAPGIAYAHLDPHTKLAYITRTLSQLRSEEMRAMHGAEKWPYLQTGHAIYSAIDSDTPSTYSPKFYQFIRRELSFDGLIIPDALNMTSASIPGKTRGEQMQLALAAGADIVMPFFNFSMPFSERWKELQKITPHQVKQFNKKIRKLKIVSKGN